MQVLGPVCDPASTRQAQRLGGAIAIGRPFGAGRRRITTLLNNLQTHDKTFGIGRCVSAAARAWRWVSNVSPDPRSGKAAPERYLGAVSECRCSTDDWSGVEITEQSQDLDVQPDQGDGQAERDTQAAFDGARRTDEPVGESKSSREAERGDADADQRR